MGPRADFSCRNCGKRHTENGGGDLVIPDLPVESTRCPVCGFRRGFRRLFNAINVSTNGHRVAGILDPMMKGQLTQLDQIKNEREQTERNMKDNYDRHYEGGTPEQREALKAHVAKNGGGRWVGGAEAKSYAGLASSPHIASDVRQHIWPTIQNKPGMVMIPEAGGARIPIRKPMGVPVKER